MADPIDREEALRLLRGGPEGVDRWNRHVDEGCQIPALHGVDLSRARLESVDFTAANLQDAILEGAYLRGAHFVDARLVRTTFSDADLQGARFIGANLLMANLRAANLVEADFFNADLESADLGEADLSASELKRANLSGADLSGADLSGANLRRANLTNTKLSGTNLSRALVHGTIFSTDLSTVQGLDSIRHLGPSDVSLRSLLSFRDALPQQFLRGCGVRDDEIAYFQSQLGAIQFYSCFISYSHADEDFAQRLYADLQSNGVRCWFAPEDIASGQKLHLQINEAIRLHEKLLLILSESSMASEWVATEIARARQREVKEEKQVLFPVRLVPFNTIRDWECFDADTGKDSARELREYFIPDFSNWKDHDSYQTAFKRLLRDLSQEGKA